ncbi:hypothetical protein LXA43DRAFT_1177346 [Ganoderma leucocontextum]|nr:hypothetical protein LXA43DRAFT_1177346 [Ganoderma leucocontextum]
MALFSPSESVYITTFLSAVDLDSSISPDGSIDPGVADRVPQLQGREALAKATKDLMSLDIPVSSGHHHNPLHVPHPTHLSYLPPNNPSYWPSIPGAESGTYRPSASVDRPPERPPSSDRSFRTIFAADGNPSHPPHVQVPPLRNFDPSSSGPGPGSGFTLPPMPVAGFHGVKVHDGGSAQARPSSASAPSVSTSAKRPLPTSSQPATDPSSSKRVRSSPSSSTASAAFPSAPDADSPSGPGRGAAARPRRSVPSQGKGTSAVPHAASGSSAANSSSGGGANGKGTLLSPSQKRANHIQSEQKRRANIRRGYEALCEVVPALREAIRAEEERERAKGCERDLDTLEEEASLADGKGSRTRGGAIDYITGLIADRSALQQRLELAQNMLPLGHPALPVELGHLDPTGVPLWEREWNGGMDLDIADLGGDDGGSEDEG